MPRETARLAARRRELAGSSARACRCDRRDVSQGGDGDQVSLKRKDPRLVRGSFANSGVRSYLIKTIFRTIARPSTSRW
jgi:hypothetical protein